MKLLLALLALGVLTSSCTQTDKNIVHLTENMSETDNGTNYLNSPLELQTKLDKALNCETENYSSDLFFSNYPDYGCQFSDSNTVGDVAAYLFPKDYSQLPDFYDDTWYDEIIVYEAKLNQLSAQEIKKDYDVFIRVIDEKYLEQLINGDSFYAIRDDFEFSIYTFDTAKNEWVQIDTDMDIVDDPTSFYIIEMLKTRSANDIPAITILEDVERDIDEDGLLERLITYKNVNDIRDNPEVTRLTLNKDGQKYKYGISEVIEKSDVLKNDSGSDSLLFSSTDMAEKYDENEYKTYNFDVNADGIDDKIISSINDVDNSFQGDDLFVFIGRKDDKYTLSLETINQTDETGWFLDYIQPRPSNAGFIIDIVYSPKGHSDSTFYYEPINGIWFLSKYVSSGTLTSGIEYYCIETEQSELPNISYGSSHDFREAEFKQYCPPLPTKYMVISDTAEILTDEFEHRDPLNYYIKGDTIEAVDQNEDWIQISYKRGDDYEFGWVSKEDLVVSE